MTKNAALKLSPFYPIVPDAAWVAHLAPLGVQTLQLRFKHEDPEVCKREVAASLCIAEAFPDLTLIINDHWRAALDYGATTIHLGQDDLANADIGRLKAANVSLGISTHTDDELATALKADPDYVALGPIFETKLKKMPWVPQGLERIGTWKQKIGGVPLVAIGGLTPNRASQVLNAGATSAAVITDFMTAPDPTARVQEWLAWEKRQVPSS